MYIKKSKLIMRTYKVTYMHKATHRSRWSMAYKVVQAVSIEDAKKRADLYPPLIKKVEQV